VLEIKKNPGCPYFKSRATKAVNLVALMNPWLPGRKTHTFKCTTKKKNACLSMFSAVLVFFFLSHTVHLSHSIKLSFEEAALHQSKNTTFTLFERQFLYSVLLFKDIQNQNRNIEFENNYGNKSTFI